ncbi:MULTISPECIES: acireductone synthase [unclassified Cyanobium]|uniref:acireductone synthase n=1 Tax=unclassified Cyanobium TaxID=2627006 RepID=UPI0028F3F213|nr:MULTISPECIES: acireductone synthase [unclassified Cyanobium]
MTSALADQLSSTMADLHARGWCDGTGGNFSCVLARAPLTLLMAPSGVDKGSVLPEELITVDAGGTVVAGAGRASAETLLHLEIVARTGAGAVLHTHSQSATLLSDWCLGDQEPSGSLLLQDLEMLKGLEGIGSHRSRVKLPVLANDQDLARLSATAGPLLAGAPQGLLIGGHGLYAWGSDLAQARRHLEILEWLLEQRWRRLLLESLGQMKPQRQEIRAVLLDIEGTTCPVPFVSQVLFPYARERLDGFLRSEAHKLALAPLLQAIDGAMAADEAGDPVSSRRAPTHGERVRFLQSLIDHDRKLPALKELQGLIWDQGYASGTLRCPLFDDVARSLRAWRSHGLQLAVYSSGSVKAQKLLYGHSTDGDLRGLFSHWFDTATGPKGEAASYGTIAKELGMAPASILFVSDSRSELEAAQAAGMATRFSVRQENPSKDPGPFEAITSLDQIVL